MNDKSFLSQLERAQKITFAELIATLSIAILLVSIAILYEAKTAVLQRYITPDPKSLLVPAGARLAVSPVGIDLINQFTKDHSYLAAVAIVSVDLPDNSRSTILRIFNDKAIEQHVIDTQHKKQEDPGILFGTNTTANTEISTLLNGEFSCTSPQSDFFTLQYNLQQQIKTVCRVPVPPYYGRLSGYLVMHSKTELSIYQIDQLRAEALKLSIDLYYTDVTNPRK